MMAFVWPDSDIQRWLERRESNALVIQECRILCDAEQLQREIFPLLGHRASLVYDVVRRPGTPEEHMEPQAALASDALEELGFPRVLQDWQTLTPAKAYQHLTGLIARYVLTGTDAGTLAERFIQLFQEDAWFATAPPPPAVSRLERSWETLVAELGGDGLAAVSHDVIGLFWLLPTPEL